LIPRKEPGATQCISKTTLIFAKIVSMFLRRRLLSVHAMQAALDSMP
jgi:hypothetical protein